jgi:hypothetical protein
MYQIEPKLQESNYQGAFVQLLSRFRRRALVVLFTEMSESAVNESIAPALALLAKRHLVVVASVGDPDVASWARSMPTEGNKAYRKAAAVVARGKRRRTVALLRSRGVTVVDAVPGAWPPVSPTHTSTRRQWEVSRTGLYSWAGGTGQDLRPTPLATVVLGAQALAVVLGGPSSA